MFTTERDIPGGIAALGPWDELPEEFKESNRAQARQVGEKLAVIGVLMVPAFDPTLDFTFDDDELQLLARLERERWMEERRAQGYEPGPARGGRTRPDLVPWERLTDEARTRNIRAVQRIPDMLAEIAATVADANTDGGFLGLGAQRHRASEAAAMAAVTQAAGPD